MPPPPPSPAGWGFLLRIEFRFYRRLLVGWLAVNLLTCLAVVYFYKVEGGHEETIMSQQKEQVGLAWSQADLVWEKLLEKLEMDNVTRDDLEMMVSHYLSALRVGEREQDNKIKWTVSRTFSFVHELWSTVGFGQVVPLTDPGKVMTVILGFIGIPLYVFNVAMWGKVLRKLLNAALLPLYRRYKNKQRAALEASEYLEGFTVHHLPSNLVVCIFTNLFILVFLLEVIFFMKQQDLKFVDSLYMSFAMVTTVRILWNFQPHFRHHQKQQ